MFLTIGLVTIGLVTIGLVTIGLVTIGLVTIGLVTIGLVTIGGGSALSKAVRRSLGIPDDWPLSPVFTDELVRLSVQGFLGMSAGEWRVTEAWESTPGRHARYVGVAVGRTRPHDALAL